MKTLNFNSFTDIGIPVIEEVELDSFRARFVHEDTGRKYSLFHYLVCERYNCLRKNSKRKFIEGKGDSKWPAKPEHLNKSYSAMPRPEINNEDKEIKPLYLMTRRRKKATTSTKDKKDFPELINIYKDKVIDVEDELYEMSSEYVTMDHNYPLYLALEEVVKKIWPSCFMEYEASDEPKWKISILDQYLTRAVALRTQESLSEIFDWCLDFLTDPPDKYEFSISSRNVLHAAEMAGVSPWIIEKTRNRMKTIFPSMPSSGQEGSQPPKQDDYLDSKQLEFGQILREFESRRMLGFDGNSRSLKRKKTTMDK